jgi:two-component system sensor histidine kinase VicK
MTQSGILAVVKAIGDLSEDGFFLFNTKRGALDYTNRALLKMFDISHIAFATQPAFFAHHVIPEDIEYLRSEQERLFTDHKIENIEFRVRMHDGQVKDISGNAYLLEQNNCVIGLLRDVTRIREHEDYIINYGAKKNTLLEMVNHNLTGPLAVSKNMIDSLEHAVSGRDEDDLKAHIRLIRENTGHCIDLVNDFLAEEHRVSQHIQVKRNRFEVADKVNTVLERFRKSYPEHHFVLKKNFVKLYVNNDDVKFLQVLNNLLSNAVKWSEDGSVVEVSLLEHDHRFSMSVTDHGIGIPDDLKATLFQRKTPTGRVGLRGEKSTGIGLYIVKQLVTLMEGTIDFQSRENEGSTFVVTFARDPAWKEIVSDRQSTL